VKLHKLNEGDISGSFGPLVTCEPFLYVPDLTDNTTDFDDTTKCYRVQRTAKWVEISPSESIVTNGLSSALTAGIPMAANGSATAQLNLSQGWWDEEFGDYVGCNTRPCSNGLRVSFTAQAEIDLHHSQSELAFGFSTLRVRASAVVQAFVLDASGSSYGPGFRNDVAEAVAHIAGASTIFGVVDIPSASVGPLALELLWNPGDVPVGGKVLVGVLNTYFVSVTADAPDRAFLDDVTGSCAISALDVEFV
jgi:hypothetical protein